MNIEQAERIRALERHRLRLATSVLVEPAVLFQLRFVVAERILRRRSGPAGIFPLGFGRQPIAIGMGSDQPAPFAIGPIPGPPLLLFGEPRTIGHGIVPSDLRHRRVVGDRIAGVLPVLPLVGFLGLVDGLVAASCRSHTSPPR